jgi:hypothetical protein
VGQSTGSGKNFVYTEVLMKSRLYFVCAAMALMAAPCLAAVSHWDGTWKLNPAKSKMTGSTVAITQNGNMYTVDTGSFKFSFGCDGKDYNVLPDRTISCTGSGNSYTLVEKIKGKLDATIKRTISADGKSLTDVTTGTRPDGTAYTDHETDTRVGAGSGMAGRWKETAIKNGAPSAFVLKVNGDVLHFENPGYKEMSDAKLDGTPAPIKGPTVPAGLIVSNKSDGPYKVLTIVSLNGKELGRDVMTVSEDGKTITDVSWTPGKESEKQVYVYEKQ